MRSMVFTADHQLSQIYPLSNPEQMAATSRYCGQGISDSCGRQHAQTSLSSHNNTCIATYQVIPGHPWLCDPHDKILGREQPTHLFAMMVAFPLRPRPFLRVLGLYMPTMSRSTDSLATKFKTDLRALPCTCRHTTKWLCCEGLLCAGTTSHSSTRYSCPLTPDITASFALAQCITAKLT